MKFACESQALGVVVRVDAVDFMDVMDAVDLEVDSTRGR